MPIESLQSSLSGLQAAEQRLAVSANNVANVLTPGFQPSLIDQVELAGGGTAVHLLSPTPSAGSPSPSSNALSFPPSSSFQGVVQDSGTDLIRETVGQILAKNSFGANIRTLQTQKAIFRSLLDIVR